MTTEPGSAGGWVLRPARPSDVETIAELRAVVLRPDLERLGRYDGQRVRQRLRDGLSLRHSSVVLLTDDGRHPDGAGDPVGSLTRRPAADGVWLEHFYLAPELQGRGLGSAVLRTALAGTDADGTDVRLNVLQGSAARRLYERHGFVVDSQDAVDVFMLRRAGPAVRARAAGPFTGPPGRAG